MRRSVWIFFASILLPSFGLAWLAIRSVQDQQVVLEHQQVIISQNITDALAKNIQARMDQTRGDFVNATQQLLSANTSPVDLARDFNAKIREAWPMGEIGFAVNLDGEIYSPEPYDGPEAKTFRSENDRFLSNRENAEVYSSNSSAVAQGQTLNLVSKEIMISQFEKERAEHDAQVAAHPSLKSTSEVLDLLTKSESVSQHQAKVARAEESYRDDGSPSAASDAPASAAPAPIPANGPPVASATDELTEPQSVPTSAPGAAKDESKLAANKTLTMSHSALPTGSPSAPPAARLSPPTSPLSEVVTQPAPAATTSDTGTSSTGASAGLGVFNRIAPTTAKQQRSVIPQQMTAHDQASLSNTVPEESDFRRAMGSETSGELARFLEDKLRLMVWFRPSVDAPIVFGAQLDQTKLVESLKISFQIPELAEGGYSRSGSNEYCVAILDDLGHPVALSRTGFVADWKHPFVATEIGEVLPHWEAALYLVDPAQIGRAARTLRFTLALIVLVLVAAIVAGGSLIAADVRRQVRLAQQKTDFVSNVSHELKTPLTSIRMFADLLAEKRVPDEERQATYLRIIAAEASRLTRLINNVLDFARIERGATPGEHHECDLVDAVRDVVETVGPHLEAAGIVFRHEIEAESLPISGDRDALAQIILNLISNAEKYGGNDVLVRVRRQETAGGSLACVDVLDRGQGIPAKDVRTVFEPFHRLDDSLSSGIPGSGLGLTLARRMARAHGGDVTYSARAGGGSCFTLTVPLRRGA
jgi:signal transduction histidine kinase